MSVSDLIATVGINCINVSWYYPDNAESYVVSCGGVTKTVSEMSATFSEEELQITASDVPVSVNLGGEISEINLSFLGWDSYSVPSPVTDLAYALASGLQLLLYWTPPTTGGYPIQSYAIEMSILDSVYSEYQNIGMSEISNFYTPDLVPGSTYKFRVTAENLAGVSEGAEISDILIVTFPDAPLNLTFENPTVDNIRMLWDTPVNNGGSPVVSYVINLYVNNQIIYSITQDVGTNILEYNLRVPRGIDIKFTIQAVNSMHYSLLAESNIIQIPPLILTNPSLRVFLSASEYSSGAWLDKSGYENNASLAEGTVSKNLNGNGIVLDGQTCWTLPNAGLSSQWTVGVWFKETAPLQSGGCIFTQIYSEIHNYFNLLIGNADREASSYSAGFYNDGFSVGPPFTLDGTWNNIQLTYYDTVITTYINGVSIGTSIGLSSDNGLGYRIGRCWDAPAYVTGEIGEIRIYNVGLTPGEVLANYNTSATTFAREIIPHTLGVPDAPSNVVAIPSATSALVSWTPEANGGSPITGYNIFCIPDNKKLNPASADATSLNVTGLKNGTAYTFSVVAINAVGSSYTAGCTPATLPGVPKVTAVIGSGQVTLSWVSKPAVGVPTDSYVITCNQSVTLPENPVSPVIITGLTNGTSYVFSVTATNNIGTSAPGASKAVIPVGLPEPPMQFAVLTGAKSFQVTWAPPFNGGLPITEYNITYVGAQTIVLKGKPVAPYTLMVTKVSGTYTVTMKAKNKLGFSSSTESITVTVD